MTEPRRSATDLVRLLAAGFVATLVWALLVLRHMADGSGAIAGRFSETWAIGLSGFALVAAILGGLAVWAFLRPRRALEGMSWLEDRTGALPRWLAWLAGMTLIGVAAAVLLSHTHRTLQLLPLRVLLALVTSLAAGVIVPIRGWSTMPRVALALVGLASVVVVGHRLALVTAYPFALGWSEGNRLWDYSLYFQSRPYAVAGAFAYPSYLTPGRHGLWGLAFLIPNVPIQVVRLWDVILWTVPYAVLGLALVARGRTVMDGYARGGFALWSLLFLTQGPIYAPLVVGAIILAFGYDRHRVQRTALFTAAACFYAGMSRWTWLLAPAMLGVVWSVIDSPSSQGLVRRMRTPMLIGLSGLAGALGSQLVMRIAFPQPDLPFATTARQALLWYRLMPSATYPSGVVPALILVATPGLLLLGMWVARRFLAWDKLAIIALSGAMAAFLVVGLAASAKIGGGSNLHNLDMFLVGMAFLGGIALISLGGRWVEALDRMSILAAFVVLVPSVLALRAGPALRLPREDVVESSLQTIQQEARAAARIGEVLFIGQRQLFTFGHLNDVPLVLDYELKDLMNQAMGANRGYLDRFQQDLRVHRFAMVVVDPVTVVFQGRKVAFGEENDAWVKEVSIPLLESYRVQTCLDEVGVCLYVPKD